MALIDSLIVFLISLGIGSLGIHFATNLVLGESDFGKAVIAALAGSIVWSVVALFFGAVPLLGPFLGLIAWIWVINSFYPGGWIDAATIGMIAWITATAIIYFLAVMNITAFEAVGVPT